jgi:hypothetical protein
MRSPKVDAKIDAYKEMINHCECAEHLARVCQHADEDCPNEYKTKWLNQAIQDAYDFLEKHNKGTNQHEVDKMIGVEKYPVIAVRRIK